MTHVVVNADDLGITVGVNRAIDTAFRAGILTSASLMANMPAFDDAVERVIGDNPRLGVGMHLVLTSGACVAAATRGSLLADRDGTFQRGFMALRRLVRGPLGVVAQEQIERELRAQCEKAMKVGIRVDHLDGHRHVHMIPEIWRIVVRLAADYGFPYVRLADERWSSSVPGRAIHVVVRNLPKKLVLSRFARRNREHLSRTTLRRPIRTADRVAGILDSDAIGVSTLGSLLHQAHGGTTEIIVHPGCPDAEPHAHTCAPMDARFLRSPNRRAELDALVSPVVAAATTQRGIHLTSFRELATGAFRAA